MQSEDDPVAHELTVSVGREGNMYSGNFNHHKSGKS